MAGENDTPAPPGNKGNGAPEPKTFSEAEVAELLNKARTDEKSKLYPDLEKVKKTAEESRKLAEDAEKRAAEAAKKAADLEKANKDAQDKIRALVGAETEEERKVREQKDKAPKIADDPAFKALQDQLAENARLIAESNKRLAETQAEAAKARLDEYRERRIREAGVELAELVTGTTREEIDASIVKVKEREEGIRKKAAEAAVKETEEKLRKNGSDRNIPRPLSPPGRDGATSNPLTSGKDRRQAVKDPKAFKAMRDQAMEKFRAG